MDEDALPHFRSADLAANPVLGDLRFALVYQAEASGPARLASVSGIHEMDSGMNMLGGLNAHLEGFYESQNP